MDVEIPTKWNGLTLEAIFRNGDQDYVFRWIDKRGEIRVIEFCHPLKTSYYHPQKKKGGKTVEP